LKTEKTYSPSGAGGTGCGSHPLDIETGRREDKDLHEGYASADEQVAILKMCHKHRNIGVRSISKDRLVKKWGALSASVLNEIEDRLRILMAL